MCEKFIEPDIGLMRWKTEFTSCLDEINRSLHLAVFYRAILNAQAENDSLEAKISQTREAHVLNLLMLASRDQIILALYRCWENGKTDGNLSFPRIAFLFNKLGEKGFAEACGIDEIRMDLARKFIRRVERFYGSARWRTLSSARTEGIAHSTIEAAARRKNGSVNRLNFHVLDQTLHFSLRLDNLAKLVFRHSPANWQHRVDQTRIISHRFFRGIQSYRVCKISSNLKATK